MRTSNLEFKFVHKGQIPLFYTIHEKVMRQHEDLKTARCSNTFHSLCMLLSCAMFLYIFKFLTVTDILCFKD